MTTDWSPCKLVRYPEEMGDPRFALVFDDFGNTQGFLEAKGFMAGGYTWHGIVDALIRRYNPDHSDSLEYDPEGSIFCVRSSNLDALKAVAQWIKRAVADETVLQEAIDNADPSIIE